MMTVSLYDTLVFTSTEEASEEVSLRCFDAGFSGSSHRNAGSALRQNATEGATGVTEVPDGRDNLAVRAAELLRLKTGCQRGIHIDLFKRIPAAAGLAGGSSDAAAVLFALNQIWQLGLSRDELQSSASEIGSDVSFFLNPQSAAICRGRGEIIEPLSLPNRLHFVIAKPPSGLSTADVFRHCRLQDRSFGVGSLVDSLRRGDLQTAGQRLSNSLQAPAEELNSDVGRLKANFSSQNTIGHLMSGSGTAYFGVCRHRREARKAAARLRASMKPSDQVFVVANPP
jgi:4-diphosphocytidyl-2-C-methyl-D-erythritol kinase